MSGVRPVSSANRSMVMTGTVVETLGALLVSMSYLLAVAGCVTFQGVVKTEVY